MFYPVVFMLCSALAVRAGATQGFPLPSQDTFYETPSDLASYQPAHVFRSRNFTARYPGDFSQASQYYYRTTDHFDNAIGTVGTVFVPKKPRFPPKIVVYNIPEDAVSINCGPSYVWVNGTPTRDTASNQLFLDWAASKGYYLVNTDAEGPKGSWLVGKTEGHSMLDGVRAAIDYLHLPTNSSVAIYGYSGGAFTSVWASTLAASYAPGLNIVGAAHGGTPVDLQQTLKSVNGTSESQLAVYGVLGLAKGYATVADALGPILTPLGRNVTTELLSLCPDANNYRIVVNGSIDPLFTHDPLDVAAIASAVAEQTLLTTSNNITVPVPRFPRFIFHGKNDSIVPYRTVAQYVDSQCRQGADVRFVGFDLLDHFPAQVAGVVAALQFLEASLENKVPKAQCGSPIPTPIVGGPVADLYLGPVLTAIALKTIVTG